MANSAPVINGKLRYAVNSVSYVNPDTPLKLADHFNIPGVFSLNSIQDSPSGSSPYLATAVFPASHHDFIEIVFQNNEAAMQTWHLDGYDFWVVGYVIMLQRFSFFLVIRRGNCSNPYLLLMICSFGSGTWTQASRNKYNLVDALTRHTTQVNAAIP